MIDFRKEPRPLRRSRVLYPALHPTERVRGSGILDEHDGMVGQLLWESYRNVDDWALRPRKKGSASTFGAAAVERRNRQLSAEWMEPELRAPLEVVRDMMAEPRRTDARVVARACRQLSAWAGERGAPVTQFYFAAAAGLCVTDDARQAYHAGCLARELAKWDAAEVWLEHAMATARRRRERETQVMAVLGMGNMYYRQGLYHRARDAQGAALVLSRKHELREIEGRALHDLFVTAAETGEFGKAEESASLALQAYRKEHPSVPSLAHDVAFFWLNSGHASRALIVLEALLPRLQAVKHRVHAWASIGWAAGLCGKQDLFDRAWLHVRQLSGESEASAALAPAFLELAYGAAGLSEYARSEEAAETALQIARTRHETDVIARAEELLGTVRAGGLPPAAGREPEYHTSAGDQLAEELVESLAV